MIKSPICFINGKHMRCQTEWIMFQGPLCGSGNKSSFVISPLHNSQEWSRPILRVRHTQFLLCSGLNGCKDGQRPCFVLYLELQYNLAITCQIVWTVWKVLQVKNSDPWYSCLHCSCSYIFFIQYITLLSQLLFMGLGFEFNSTQCSHQCN